MSALDHAAAAGVATVFMVTVFWRRAAKVRCSVDDAQRASDPDPSTSDPDRSISGADIEVPAIFLSHSGKQKPFVEHLYDALQSANHTAFFDEHSLPKGSPFPPRIIQAAHGCKLGVVVLSNDFLTSKWPMLELEMLVLQRGPDASVLPIFYNLRPTDLKDRKNLFKWRRVWKEKAGQRKEKAGLWKEKAGQHADKWERAVKALGSFNGEVFVQGTSEAAFINRVVRRICDHVPSPTPYDLSPIQGRERLAKVVASQFKEAARQCGEVYCMVGLYAVGGMGKTTICKIMTNFYYAHYLGKSYHIEFPSDGDNNMIVQECKKALKKLTNLSELFLNNANSFEQVVQLMKENLRRYDVFLAIDNVWMSSVEAAKRIMEVSFSANSKILLTSRSKEVLEDLVRNRSNTSLGPLPSPKQDEAFQIFQNNFELDDLNSVNRQLLDSVLKRCFLSGYYHALALKALGRYVKNVCLDDGLDKIEHSLSNIVQEIRENTEVDDLIRLNYVDLAVEKKHMFLDIVTVVRPEATYAKAHHWLSILYKKSSGKISNIIHELALHGLIELENIDHKSAEKVIRVHDLYCDLAQKEAAESDRFFTDGSTKSVEEIEWKRLERVILRELPLRSHFIEELLQQQESRKLQVLCAKNIDIRSGINLNFVPSLCVLKLESWTVRSINWSCGKGLAIVHLSDLECAEPLDSIPSCQDLFLENVDTAEVRRLVSPTLKNVEIRGCGALKRMPDMSGLPCLEKLELSYNESMEEVGGLSPALKNVEVRGCKALEKMPDLSGLTCLETLELFDNRSMVEVGGLSSALKVVRINGCGALKRMPDVSGLTCLQSLELEENELMEEVGAENLSSSVESLGIHDCKRLMRFPSLNECVQLQKLIARACLMKNIGSTSHELQPPEAQYVIDDVWRCMERLISGVTHLQSLTIKKCDSLLKFEVGCLPSSLKYLQVNACKALKEIGDLSVLHSICTLHVNACKTLEEIGDLSALHSLRTLVVRDCPSLSVKKLDALYIPQLQHCVVVGCYENNFSNQ